ncbi:MAG: hypothetical protein IPG43_16985 [Proteobacteria bacterium]|nr:hypothetical protein [Pseudomonadota bacterium]
MRDARKVQRQPYSTCGDAPTDWRSLVEQIAELEDILMECGAALDRGADLGRARLHRLLRDKRRQLRGIDVAVQAPGA